MWNSQNKNLIVDFIRMEYRSADMQSSSILHTLIFNAGAKDLWSRYTSNFPFKNSISSNDYNSIFNCRMAAIYKIAVYGE